MDNVKTANNDAKFHAQEGGVEVGRAAADVVTSVLDEAASNANQVVHEYAEQAEQVRTEGNVHAESIKMKAHERAENIREVPSKITEKASETAQNIKEKLSQAAETISAIPGKIAQGIADTTANVVEKAGELDADLVEKQADAKAHNLEHIGDAKAEQIRQDAYLKSNDKVKEVVESAFKAGKSEYKQKLEQKLHTNSPVEESDTALQNEESYIIKYLVQKLSEAKETIKSFAQHTDTCPGVNPSDYKEQSEQVRSDGSKHAESIKTKAHERAESIREVPTVISEKASETAQKVKEKVSQAAETITAIPGKIAHGVADTTAKVVEKAGELNADLVEKVANTKAQSLETIGDIKAEHSHAKNLPEHFTLFAQDIDFGDLMATDAYNSRSSILDLAKFPDLLKCTSSIHHKETFEIVSSKGEKFSNTIGKLYALAKIHSDNYIKIFSSNSEVVAELHGHPFSLNKNKLDSMDYLGVVYEGCKKQSGSKVLEATKDNLRDTLNELKNMYHDTHSGHHLHSFQTTIFKGSGSIISETYNPNEFNHDYLQQFVNIENLYFAIDFH